MSRLESLLVSRIPSRLRMRLALVIGLMSLAAGIGIWWPMVAAGEFRDTAAWIPCYYLVSIFANTLGISLIRRWIVIRKESQRRIAGIPEPEPLQRKECRDCQQGQLIPRSVAVLGCFAVMGYLMLAISLLFSALLAHSYLTPSYLTPFPSAPSVIDGTAGFPWMVIVFMLLGWGMRLRMTELTCDHCHRRHIPGPPSQDLTATHLDAEGETTGEV